MLASCCYWSLISVLVDAFCFELDSFYRLSKKCTYLKMVLWLNPLNVLLFVHCIFASILNASTSFLQHDYSKSGLNHITSGLYVQVHTPNSKPSMDGSAGIVDLPTGYHTSVGFSLTEVITPPKSHYVMFITLLLVSCYKFLMVFFCFDKTTPLIFIGSLYMYGLSSVYDMTNFQFMSNCCSFVVASFCKPLNCTCTCSYQQTLTHHKAASLARCIQWLPAGLAAQLTFLCQVQCISSTHLLIHQVVSFSFR